MKENIKFRNSRNLLLNGTFYKADSDSIIVMSHGFTADQSEWGRFEKVAKVLNDQGYNILTFDFSGCGKSDDDTLTVDKQVDDLKSAIKLIKSKKFGKIGLFAHSLGGLIALKCFNQDILTMYLWAPVTDKIKYTWDKRYSEKQLIELKTKGYITDFEPKRIRKKVIIDKQMLNDREFVDQKELLKNITCPIFFIHGKLDKSVPYTDSINASKILDHNSELLIVEDANHRFFDHMQIVL